MTFEEARQDENSIVLRSSNYEVELRSSNYGDTRRNHLTCVVLLLDVFIVLLVGSECRRSGTGWSSNESMAS